MSDKRRVLFVCARNDARSLMAEALLRHADAEDFDAFSAGLEASEIDPRTLESLEHIGIDTEGLRSKALDEFAGQQFHHVITLCDKSSEEAARMPSSGEVIVWNFGDPVTSDRHEPFRHTLQEIHDRLHMFITVKTRS
ncbi:protein-tyrosine-phosphatase [Pseudomonas chlororaphis subsp. aurantiaca]|uniref:arsenate reductase ArsC n=1 Tax=Pseudomonas chlororaphis TaxID=587753 RepID=UPI0008656F5D|nr:arsenate reductase ArsC [Pseudomonas chlororaphis]BAV74327.1 protein-tyrosine-phosphatase [Pseudomonas chlororaphis subsp. aurantiaca]